MGGNQCIWRPYARLASKCRLFIIIERRARVVCGSTSTLSSAVMCRRHACAQYQARSAHSLEAFRWLASCAMAQQHGDDILFSIGSSLAFLYRQPVGADQAAQIYGVDMALCVRRASSRRRRLRSALALSSPLRQSTRRAAAWRHFHRWASARRRTGGMAYGCRGHCVKCRASVAGDGAYGIVVCRRAYRRERGRVIWPITKIIILSAVSSKSASARSVGRFRHRPSPCQWRPLMVARCIARRNLLADINAMSSRVTLNRISRRGNNSARAHFQRMGGTAAYLLNASCYTSALCRVAGVGMTYSNGDALRALTICRISTTVGSNGGIGASKSWHFCHAA